jgi:hypothetical protein
VKGSRQRSILVGVKVSVYVKAEQARELEAAGVDVATLVRDAARKAIAERAPETVETLTGVVLPETRVREQLNARGSRQPCGCDD